MPCPNIPPHHPPKKALKRRTKYTHRRKHATSTRTTRQLFLSQLGVIKTSFCLGVDDTGTTTSEQTESAVVEGGTESVLEFSRFEGSGWAAGGGVYLDVFGVFFRSTLDGLHLWDRGVRSLVLGVSVGLWLWVPLLRVSVWLSIWGICLLGISLLDSGRRRRRLFRVHSKGYFGDVLGERGLRSYTENGCCETASEVDLMICDG